MVSTETKTSFSQYLAKCVRLKELLADILDVLNNFQIRKSCYLQLIFTKRCKFSRTNSKRHFQAELSYETKKKTFEKQQNSTG